jgi:mannose-6-phosphate isomerase-like protein (cupin superfamily)
MVELGPGEGVEDAASPANEHWAVIAGSVGLGLGGVEVELFPGDVGLLRAGTRRRLYSVAGARLALARE